MADSSALSSTLGLLQHLAIEELKEILNDNEKFDNITKEAKIKCNDATEKDMLMVGNKSLAEYNLSRSDEFKEEKSHLSELYLKLDEINSRIEAKITSIKELSKKSDSERVLAILQTATAELERQTDAFSDNLLNGDISLEAFIEQYPTQRKKVHLRKAKLEKMTEMISRRQLYKSNLATPRIMTISQSNVTSGYSALNYSNAPVHAPYPIEPMNMPMPTPYTPNSF